MSRFLLLSLCFFPLSGSPPVRAQAGSLDPAYDPHAEGAYVLAAAVQRDGKAVIGGRFITMGRVPQNNLARLNVDGSRDASFLATTNEEVRNVIVQPDGKILIGGFFTTVFSNGNAIARNRIARLNADGSVESTATFDAGSGAENEVFSLVLQRDGKILVAGGFTRVNGAARNGIARLNADGSLESLATFNPGTGVNGTVYAAAVQADGKILIGGTFSAVNGVTRHGLARLNIDGSLESTDTFNPGTGANSGAGCFAVQPDGKIVVGGVLRFGGAEPKFLVRLNADGSPESTATFNPGTGPSSDVYSVAVQADGKILLGGQFSSVNGATRNRIARLNADGSLENTSTFNAGTGTDNQIYNLGLQGDGRILLGGNFQEVNRTRRNYLARLLNDAAAESLTVPNTATAQWLRSGAAPEVSQVTFELSTNGGVTWSPLGQGTRIAGGWQRSGLSLPANGSIRASGRTTSGYGNGASGITGTVAAFRFFPEIAVYDGVDNTEPPLTDAQAVPVDFGTVRQGTTRLHRITIINEGVGPLRLADVTLPAGFALNGALALPQMIDPGTSLAVELQATAAAPGTFAGNVSILSDDLDEAEFTFPVTVTVVSPEIALHDGATTVAPELNDDQTAAVDFGRNVQGTFGTRDFTITNTGTAELRIAGITVPPGYSGLFVGTLPLFIGPGQSLRLQVNLAISTVGRYAGNVEIASDDLDEALFDFPLTGEVFIPDPVAGIVSASTTLNRQSGLREQTVRITNDTTATVPAYNLIIRGLPAGVEVNNASEVRADGSVVVYIRQGLQPHSTQDIVIEYYSPNRSPAEINPQLSTEVILTPPDLTVPPGGASLTIDNITRLTDGEMMIEFTSVPGQRYQVQYSSDGQTWLISLPPITAAGNRTQWIDRGLPRTDSHPATQSSRIYRVALLP